MDFLHPFDMVPVEVPIRLESPAGYPVLASLNIDKRLRIHPVGLRVPVEIVGLEPGSFLIDQNDMAEQIQQSGFLAVRTRKRALDVPEEFAFEQVRGKCGAIDGDKCAVASVPYRMDSLCSQFLSGSSFANDQDGVARALGDKPYHLQRPVYRGAVPDHLYGRRAVFGKVITLIAVGAYRSVLDPVNDLPEVFWVFFPEAVERTKFKEQIELIMFVAVSYDDRRYVHLVFS